MPAPTGRVIQGHPFDFAQAEHAHPSRNWHNLCQMFTHLAFDVLTDGTPTAAEAWRRAKYRHPETDPANIPRGVPTFWVGGSSGAGHAVVSRGGGSCWGTDLIRDGQVDVYDIADVHARWGLTLVGWTEDIDGVRVWEATPPPPPPIKQPLPDPTSHPNIDAARGSLRKAFKANRPGRVRAAVRAALKALKVIP